MTFPSIEGAKFLMATRKPTGAGIVTGDEINDVDAMVTGREIAQADRFSHEQLANIESFDDAMRLAVAEFGGVINAHEDKNLGTGFKLTSDEDKFRLIGVPLLLLDWRFNSGDFSDEFVSIHVIQQDETGKGIKWVLNDGGTGICRDLKNYTQKTGRKGGLFCRKGLRVSEYDTIADGGPDNGKPAPRDYVGKTGKGKTFYLDFSA